MVKTLPDIKAVRTDFLINFAAMTVAVLALGWLLYVQGSILQVDGQIRRLNDTIDGNSRVNKTYLSESSKFMHESKALQELTKFSSQTVPPFQLLTTLVEARPDNILFDSVAIEPTEIEGKNHVRIKTEQVVLAGTLSGEADDLKGLDTLVTKLMNSPVLKARIADPANDRQIDNHREGPGLFKFIVTITLKPVV
ncbi:MAG: hypothetical protein ABSH19_00350 [Opitutales bacterium]